MHALKAIAPVEQLLTVCSGAQTTAAAVAALTVTMPPVLQWKARQPAVLLHDNKAAHALCALEIFAACK